MATKLNLTKRSALRLKTTSMESGKLLNLNLRNVLNLFQLMDLQKLYFTTLRATGVKHLMIGRVIENSLQNNRIE